MMVIRFLALLDSGLLLPFTFDTTIRPPEPRIRLETPVKLKVDPADGLINCLHVDLQNKRLACIASTPFASWSAAYELKLDGGVLRRTVVPSSGTAGITSGGAIGSLINTRSGVHIWTVSKAGPFPLAPQNNRVIDGSAQPGIWMDGDGCLIITNSDGSVILHDATDGASYELTLERFGLESQSNRAEDSRLRMASLRLRGDRLTLAWSSELPLRGDALEFESVLRCYDVARLIRQARRGDDLDQPLEEFEGVAAPGQIWGACFLPKEADDQPDHLFLAGFPKGMFCHYVRRPPGQPNEMSWVLNGPPEYLHDLLQNQEPKLSSQYARFLQLGKSL